MNRAELKAKAKKVIDGKIFTLFAIMLIIGVATAILSFITFGLGSVLITGGITLSLASIYLGIVNKNRTPVVNDIIYGFKSKTYLNGLVGFLRQTIFTALWSLLFFIPGIIKGIAYSMMFFIMADDPKIDAGDAQKKSIAMTHGHKGDICVLYLSFFPWLILVGLTFGLAAIYVAPYIQATLALYYENLKTTK